MITLVIVAIAIAALLLGIWVGRLITKDDTYHVNKDTKYRESNNMYNRQRTDLFYNNPVMEQLRKDRSQQMQHDQINPVNKKY